jgi:hypothetical protein
LVCGVTVAVTVVVVVTGAPLWLSLVFVAGCVLFVSEQLLRHAFQVRVSQDGTVEFRAPLRRRITTAREVRSIKRRRWGWGEGGSNDFKIAFLGGSVLLRGRSDARVVADAILKLNPEVETSGIPGRDASSQ